MSCNPNLHPRWQPSKNTNLVYDHPMNISAKFGSNLFCGFRKLEALKPLNQIKPNLAGIVLG
jgi:hypothetical protein